jgi:LPS export ABC transporter protein LptC
MIFPRTCLYSCCTLLFLLISGAFTSCVNDLDSIQKVTFKPSDPDERMANMHVFYNDSGYARIEVFAKLAETYSKPESVVKLKDGVLVKFFSTNGEIVSELTALYGEIHQDKGTMFVRDSVQLFNYDKQQRMETEELHWNQKDSAIYTNKAVIVRTPEALFFGQGIRTKQDFSSYEFLQPTGTINLGKRK